MPFIFCKTSAQEISGQQLLERAIHYHDRRATGIVCRKTNCSYDNANGTERHEISIDFPNQHFKLSTIKNDKLLNTVSLMEFY
jgi:hypothetical protein